MMFKRIHAIDIYNPCSKCKHNWRCRYKEIYKWSNSKTLYKRPCPNFKAKEKYK